MGIVLFVVFGFVAGLLARLIMPGPQRMGFVMTTVLGVAGSFIGGFLVSLVSNNRVAEFHATGLIGSVTGAIILLFIGGSLARGRTLA